MSATTLAATTGGQALWFASRGTGIVSLILLTTSVVLGIITSVRFETPRWPRFVTLGLHRNVSLLILVFIALHIGTTVADGFAPIGYLDSIVPFRTPYRTMWLGFGTVAVDLLIALTVTSLVRVRLGYNTWRIVHWLAYLCWPVAVMHGLGAGSDTRERWMLGIYLAVAAIVLAAAAWRISTIPPELERVRQWTTAALIVVPIAIGVWALKGPMTATWSHSFTKHAAVTAGTAAR